MQGGGRLAAGKDPPAKSAICARQRERWRGGEADWPRACRYQCTPRRAVRRTARHTTRQATTATTASMRRARPAHDGRTGSRVISGTRRGHSHLKRTLLSSFVCVDYDSESSPASTPSMASTDGHVPTCKNDSSTIVEPSLRLGKGVSVLHHVAMPAGSGGGASLISGDARRLRTTIVAIVVSIGVCASRGEGLFLGSPFFGMARIFLHKSRVELC